MVLLKNYHFHIEKKMIFDKIKNLHVKVDSKDSIFFKGFLDSPILIYKSEHNMIYEMLSLLNKEDLLHMSSHQLLEVIANKKLPSDFKHLAFSPSGSEERCGSIKELIDLYTDTEKTNLMDETPFYVLDMENLTEQSLETLYLFEKSNFSESKIISKEKRFMVASPFYISI